MVERQAFIDRVKGAVRECYVVAAAVNHYERAVEDSGAHLPDGTSPRDLVTAADKVESTYMIRMWAEFETALRSYRRHITRGPRRPNQHEQSDRLDGRPQTGSADLGGRPG